MTEIGQNLSHYSIVAKIGKGGMGEVFRAKDQKLGIDVSDNLLRLFPVPLPIFQVLYLSDHKGF